MITNMKRKLSFTFLFICVLFYTLRAQKFYADSSYVHFFSEAPLENIEAYSNETKSLIDIETLKFAFTLPISSFTFENSLMQEHFNENYLESDMYPNTTFMGEVENWDGSEGAYVVNAVGTLRLHGVERDVTIESKLTYGNNQISVETTFPVVLQDYKIKIPKAVFYNIAEVVDVTCRFTYSPYEK